MLDQKCDKPTSIFDVTCRIIMKYYEMEDFIQINFFHKIIFFLPSVPLFCQDVTGNQHIFLFGLSEMHNFLREVAPHTQISKGRPEKTKCRTDLKLGSF